MESDNKMFSVEQIELIRRLRNSGITKEQVVAAFDSLDRLDNELGTLYNIPLNKQHDQKDNKDKIKPKIVKIQGNVKKSSVSTDKKMYIVNNPKYTESDTAKPKPNITYHIVKPKPGSDSNIKKIPQVIPRKYIKEKSSETENPSSKCSMGTMTRGFSDYSIMSMADDPSACVGHDSEYETKFIPQQNSGISTVSYVVTRKKKKTDELEDDCPTVKVNLKQKYTGAENTNPPKKSKRKDIIEFVEDDYNQPTMHIIESDFEEKMASMQDESQSPVNGQRVTMVMPDSQDLVKTYPAHQRREKFRFQEKHLVILEAQFKKNPYPSYEQREDIAYQCNMACSNDGEIQLRNKEMMTSHRIMNWFANRRKENKRLAKEDGIVIYKNRSLMSDEVPSQVYNDEATSDLSNDSIPTSSDEKKPHEELIVIKCEQQED